ncbi:helix-turn-helix domain-containing protein [Flavobacterium sp. 3HN19-14]|uniref:helix-turn-helix domain-containing protein n=1 Tax=Flavobacterium sp. 3HN19-14 TaxID=3448133 RepID=UPI003EE41FC0
MEKIEALMTEQRLLSKEFLTLTEAAEYLGQTKSSLYKMTSKKTIPYYCPGGKNNYFRRSELDMWMSGFRVASASEIGNDVEKYLSRFNTVKP